MIETPEDAKVFSEMVLQRFDTRRSVIAPVLTGQMNNQNRDLQTNISALLYGQHTAAEHAYQHRQCHGASALRTRKRQ